MKRLDRKFWYIVTQLFLKKQFADIKKGSVIYRPLQLDCVSSIHIDESVYIAEGAWLMGNSEKNATIYIGSGTTIGHYAHLIGIHSVTIEAKVLIADRVFISDCTHRYDDISNPVIKQDIKELSPVIIGEGSWIGENVCICGASIGKHCVVGANSVVTTNIPDYCVAVGSPARVVKKYDFDRNEWVKEQS